MSDFLDRLLLRSSRGTSVVPRLRSHFEPAGPARGWPAPVEEVEADESLDVSSPGRRRRPRRSSIAPTEYAAADDAEIPQHREPHRGRLDLPRPFERDPSPIAPTSAEPVARGVSVAQLSSPSPGRPELHDAAGMDRVESALISPSPVGIAPSSGRDPVATSVTAAASEGRQTVSAPAPGVSERAEAVRPPVELRESTASRAFPVVVRPREVKSESAPTTVREEGPVIRVTIGRIDVRAIQEAPAARPDRPSPPAGVPLEEYRRQRLRGER